MYVVYFKIVKLGIFLTLFKLSLAYLALFTYQDWHFYIWPTWQLCLSNDVTIIMGLRGQYFKQDVKTCNH